MSAAGAGAGIPQQPGQLFGGRRPGYWIRHMNGRSTTLQAPDGSTVEVPTAHMPHGSAPGQQLNEQAFMVGHQQRQLAAQARSPFVQQLAQQAGAAFAPAAVTPGMMIQPDGGPIAQNAQRLPGTQPGTSPAVSAPGSVGAASLPPSAAAPPVPVATQDASPAVGSVEWMNSIDPAQRAQLIAATPGFQGKIDLGKMIGQPLTDAQIAMQLGGTLKGQNVDPATAIYNAAQQQFTRNNQGYGTTGYQGNDAQVASQVAHGAQASSIPTGVLGSSFWQGGSNFGGAQTADNTASGNNGATNWNDPSVSGFGVDSTLPQNLVTGIAGLRTVLANTPVTTGQIGQAVSSIPEALSAYRIAQQTQPTAAPTSASFTSQLAAADPSQQQPGAYGTRPVTPGMMIPDSGPVTSNAQQVGPSSSGSVDYTPRQPAIVQPAQGTVTGGGYTPPAGGTQTQLVTPPPVEKVQQQPMNTQPATQKLSGTSMPTNTAAPTATQQQSQQPPTDSAFQRALANAQVAPSTGPATEALKGRAHF